MRRHLLGKALSCAVIGVLGLLPHAQATTVDFETLSPNIFFDGDTFSERGYGMKVGGDFGVVDTAAAFFVAQAPSGNDTQFYAGLNDSRLLFARDDALPFRLDGFDAAFIAPQPQDPGVLAGRLQVTAIDLLGNTVSQSFEFAASGADGLFPFTSFGGADFAAFGSVRSVSFGACVYVSSVNDCESPFQNLGQFALDNINVAVVPEPSTYALLAVGLIGLALRGRRVAR